MTSTSVPQDRATGSYPVTAPMPLVPPPKLRRRTSLLVGGGLAITLGAVFAAWVWSATTNTEEVLAARATIHRSELINAGDIEQVRINGDPALHPLPASAIASVIGKRATLDVAAGGLLTAGSTASDALPPKGQSIVGISLTAAQLPALSLQGGDVVRIVVTPGQNSDASSGAPTFTNATVLDTKSDDATGNTVVDVEVPYADAAVLAGESSTGNVALILDSPDSGGR